tara:strand:- start:7 stop:732 length:726 start_codon:yes stop_codon:yes gene_type:complete
MKYKKLILASMFLVVGLAIPSIAQSITPTETVQVSYDEPVSEDVSDPNYDKSIGNNANTDKKKNRSSKNLLKAGFGLTEGVTAGYERIFGKNHGLHVSYGTLTGLESNSDPTEGFTNLKQTFDLEGAGVGYRYYFSKQKTFSGAYVGLGVVFKTLEITETNDITILGQTDTETGSAKSDVTIPYVELGLRGRVGFFLVGAYLGYGVANYDFEFTGTITEDRLEFAQNESWPFLGIDMGVAF